jgi:hypothetical protein
VHSREAPQAGSDLRRRVDDSLADALLVAMVAVSVLCWGPIPLACLPIPDPDFWKDLERYILETGALPHHYLLTRRSRARKGFVGAGVPEEPMSAHAGHKWWYGCLERAGIVPAGTTSGEKMHKARHTAGQRLLDHTGNLKAAQKLLGHASIQTTGDIYTDWDIDQLEASLAYLAEHDDSRIVPTGRPREPMFMGIMETVVCGLIT